MKRIKKWLAWVLTVILLVNLLPVAALAVELLDDPEITRAQLASMIYEKGTLKMRIDKAGEGKEAPQLADKQDIQAKYAEHEAAIYALLKAEVLNGIKNADGSVSFNPGGTVERFQAVLVLWSAMGKETVEAGEVPFDDVDQIAGASDDDRIIAQNAMFLQAFRFLAAKGILTADDATVIDGKKCFQPHEPAKVSQLATWLSRVALTRAELAEMIYDTFYPGKSVSEDAPVYGDISGCTTKQQTAIRVLAQARVLNGTASGTFTPDGTVTRAQAAVALWRAAGCLSNKAAATLPYTDITGDLGWAVAALNCLYALKVLEQDTTQFRPNDAVTAAELSAWLTAYGSNAGNIGSSADSGGISRAEMIVIFYHAYQDALPDLPTEFTPDFDDIADCTDEQKAVITLFHELKYDGTQPIVVGVAEGQFAPFAPVTNRQTAALLQRTIQYIEREKSASAATLSSFGSMELQSDIVYDATLQFLMERGLQTASADTIHTNPNAPSCKFRVMKSTCTEFPVHLHG